MGTSTVYHIIYSTYYLDGWDTFIVVTDGTTTNLWPEYNTVFRIMSPMELIDIERLEKTPQADSTNTARKGGKPSQ